MQRGAVLRLVAPAAGLPEGATLAGTGDDPSLHSCRQQGCLVASALLHPCQKWESLQAGIAGCFPENINTWPLLHLPWTFSRTLWEAAPEDSPASETLSSYAFQCVAIWLLYQKQQPGYPPCAVCHRAFSYTLAHLFHLPLTSSSSSPFELSSCQTVLVSSVI